MIPFLNILFTYGLETAYFRYVQQTNQRRLFNTLSLAIIVSTVFFSGLLLFFTAQLAGLSSLASHPEYFRWMVYILFFDTLSVLPFARLRQEERPRKYAFIKVINVVITVLIVLYFLRFCPVRYALDPHDSLVFFYTPGIGIGYYILANAVASVVTFLMLWREWKGFSLQFDGKPGPYAEPAYAATTPAEDTASNTRVECGNTYSR